MSIRMSVAKLDKLSYIGQFVAKFEDIGHKSLPIGDPSSWTISYYPN